MHALFSAGEAVVKRLNAFWPSLTVGPTVKEDQGVLRAAWAALTVEPIVKTQERFGPR